MTKLGSVVIEGDLPCNSPITEKSMYDKIDMQLTHGIIYLFIHDQDYYM